MIRKRRQPIDSEERRQGICQRCRTFVGKEGLVTINGAKVCAAVCGPKLIEQWSEQARAVETFLKQKGASNG